MKETTQGAYCHTPHQSIGQLVATAEKRVSSGEDAYNVRQDIVNGYSLGFGSANDSLIQSACAAGLSRIAGGAR